MLVSACCVVDEQVIGITSGEGAPAGRLSVCQHTQAVALGKASATSRNIAVMGVYGKLSCRRSLQLLLSMVTRRSFFAPSMIHYCNTGSVVFRGVQVRYRLSFTTINVRSHNFHCEGHSLIGSN